MGYYIKEGFSPSDSRRGHIEKGLKALVELLVMPEEEYNDIMKKDKPIEDIVDRLDDGGSLETGDDEEFEWF